MKRPALKIYDPDKVPQKEPSVKVEPQVASETASVKVEGKKDNFIPLADLPSNYRFYDPEVEILARPMTVSEVKLLASMNEENADYIISDVISRTVKGIDVSDILRADKYYILFWLRANTYKSAGYEIDFRCPHCGKDSHYDFTVSVFDVTYVKEDTKDFNEVTLPESGTKIVLKFLRMKDEKRMKDFLSMSEKGGRVYDRDLLELAASIDSINGNKKSIRENYEFVDALSPVDFSFIVSYLDSTVFGISNQVQATCGHCREVSPVAIRFREEFFIPKFKFR